MERRVLATICVVAAIPKLIKLRCGQSETQDKDFRITWFACLLGFACVSIGVADSQIILHDPIAPALGEMPNVCFADTKFGCHLLVAMRLQPSKRLLLIFGGKLQDKSTSLAPGQARLLCPQTDSRLRDSMRSSDLFQGIVAIRIKIEHLLAPAVGNFVLSNRVRLMSNVCVNNKHGKTVIQQSKTVNG
jgi:hypothetical protein